MSQFAIDQVLSQIRAMQGAQRSALAPVAGGLQQAAGAGAGPSAPSFADALKRGIDKVNETQQSASRLQDAFQRGEPGVQLGQVMIEMQKASVALKATTEVRNRLISAYQDIMNMPI
jgi:flagellar hook-basal body complex protein FliE